MKSVLISIQPKWVEKIASGEKTVEVRKTRPKLEMPFKCYIYCTKGKDLLREVDCSTRKGTYKTNYKIINLDYCTNKIANGKVIGEFVCNKIIEHESEFWDDETYESIGYIDYDEEYGEREKYIFAENGEENALCKYSCLTWNELREYIGQDIKTFYGWHISDLVIYDKPKELSEFKYHCKYEFDDDFKHCESCDYHYYSNTPSSGIEEYCTCDCLKTLTRPPQSWCYVESLGE
jgi:predicted transcriptional regulator